MFLVLIFITTFTFLFASNECNLNNSFSSNLRSIYNIGDTLTVEDQSRLYPVCNGSGAYETGDSFSFSDLNGSVNGGDYKITVISMNATW